MARTIGKKNIELVKRRTRLYLKKNPRTLNYNESNIVSLVSSKLPDHMFDIWEGAYDEIQRIILDTTNEKKN